MSGIFSVQDRQDAFEYILSVSKECDKIVSLVQVGSGAIGFHDDRSDLDFVAALDKGESMLEVMEYMRRRISEKYELIYFKQAEQRHLQVYLLPGLLEIDIGYGGYEHAAARKPSFKVLYDRTGTVEQKMRSSLEWMDDSIYGEKRKRDAEAACDSAWAHLMHAAVAIRRGNYLRALGELESGRRQYLDLLGDRYRLESDRNRELDKLPEHEKAAIMRTYVTGEGPETLWTSLLALTELLYKELEGSEPPVTLEMLLDYYRDLRERECQ